MNLEDGNGQQGGGSDETDEEEDGLADGEDEFIVALLFFTCCKSLFARNRLDRLPLDRELLQAVRVLDFDTHDYIPDPFRHRMERIRMLTESKSESERLSGFWALSTYCQYIALSERQIQEDLDYYNDKFSTPKVDNAIRILNSRLGSVRSEKRMLKHYFGEKYEEYTK